MEMFCLGLNRNILLILLVIVLFPFAVACAVGEKSVGLETTIAPSSDTAFESVATLSTVEPSPPTAMLTATSNPIAEQLDVLSTSTPLATFIPVLTEEEEIIAEPTSLADAILTATSSLSEGVTETVSYTSPTGLWQASVVQTYAAERTVYQRIVVFGERGEVTAAERWTYAGLGSDAPQILQWSADESVLWYGFFGAPDGCSLGGFWSGITRLDLLTGEEMLIGEDIYALPAPDEQTFAEFDESSLTIRNQATGDEKQIALPIVETQFVARPFWNPASERVAFLVSEPNGECQISTSVLYVFLTDMGVHQTRFSSDPLLFIDQWVSNEILSLVDVDGGKWFLDTNDGLLTAQE